MKFIIGSTCLSILLLTGCGQTQKEEKKEPLKVEKTQTKIEEVAENLKQSTNKAIDKAAVIAENITEKTADVVIKVSEQTKKISDKAVAKINVIKKELDTKLDEVTQTSVQRGEKLYLKCSGCHGQNAEKIALGKSKVLKGWEKEKILNALIGYKNGTYGSSMKALMAGQVKNLSDKDIEDVSVYIGTL